ncbi:MAG: hypothetical protein OJF47_003125 [Nitrospira sp.]|jgi:hypothetical protein|nr:MAG: hypothetical protein OJF47_003125 [Nitrospira sp.]
MLFAQETLYATRDLVLWTKQVLFPFNRWESVPITMVQ